jgi:hypothetical protein
MSKNVHDVLLLFLFMAACSGFNYLVAILFVRIFIFLKRKLDRFITFRSVCLWFVWAITIVLKFMPLFLAFGFHRPVDPVWALLVILFGALSAIPASRYVRKNLGSFL